jgi:general L-amino acid transport system substrate-binding protein
MLKRLGILVLALLFVFSATHIALGQDGPQVGPITKAIMDRGELICGANKAGLAGFATVNANGEWQGFDVDICRAVAVAILGDATKVTFRPLEAGERQAAIQSGEIDMMSRNSTFTLTRDTTWGADFGPTTFYDGQGFLVKADSGITTIEQLAGLTICVQSGTTTELNLADAFKVRNLEYTPKVFGDAAATWDAFVQGGCDSFTTDRSGLVGYRGSSPDPSAYSILDVTISKEPLGPLSPQSDPQFADIIRWTVYGLIQAEEYGITSKNVDEFTKSEVPEIQRFLGQGENASGSLLGIKNDFMVTVIKQVGNYGEIFDRNLGPDTPFKLGRGLNALWTNGGLLYSPPFR